MNRLTWATIIWALVASATFKNVVANAVKVDENMNIDKLNALLSQQNNRLSLDHNDRLRDAIDMKDRIEDESEIYGKEPATIGEDVDETEEKDDIADSNENETVDAKAIRKRLRKNRMTDILVACFFFVAAVWLLLATGYSIILLVLLRLQARGELDIYDENLGRVVLCNGRITLHFGCILRRYAIQLEEVSCSLGSKVSDRRNNLIIILIVSFFSLFTGLSNADTTTVRRFQRRKRGTTTHSNHDSGRTTKCRRRASWRFRKDARRRIRIYRRQKELRCKMQSRNYQGRCLKEIVQDIIQRYIVVVFRRRTRLFDLSRRIRANRFGVPIKVLSSHVPRRLLVLMAGKEKQHRKWRESILFLKNYGAMPNMQLVYYFLNASS